jgi:hypothetical protein
LVHQLIPILHDEHICQSGESHGRVMFFCVTQVAFLTISNSGYPSNLKAGRTLFHSFVRSEEEEDEDEEYEKARSKQCTEDERKLIQHA